MPGLGRPSSLNAFSKISMNPGKVSTNKKNKNVGETLNEIAGNRNKATEFVERKNHNKLGKDSFLKLLTHQLKNQDPLKPMDQKQFAADLAQFSQLEQLTSVNKQLGNLGKNSGSESKFYGASFLGKEVTTKSSSIKYDGKGGKVEVPYFLPQRGKHVMVRIYDSHKQLIQQVELENVGQGAQSFSWDGSSLDKTIAVDDTYSFNIRAWDEKLQEFQGETRAKGIVTGIFFDNGETVLEVDRKKKVFLRDVTTFSLAKENTESVNKLKQQTAKSSYKLQ